METIADKLKAKQHRFIKVVRNSRLVKAEWEEDKHPRADDGKFGDKGAGSGEKEKPKGKSYDPNKKRGDITRLDNGSIKISTDYDPDFVTRARKLKGQWDRSNRVWEFDKENSAAAESYFDMKYNDFNDNDIKETFRSHKQNIAITAKKEAENQANDENAVFDPHKKSGRMIIGDNSISIIGDYHPGFIADIKNITGRKWNGDNKSWSIPVSQYEAGKKVFDKYYNNIDNNKLKQVAQKEKADEQKAYEEEAKKTPATSKQRDYIDLLGQRYTDTNGNPITAKSFGETLNKHKASQIIDGLKGGEEQVSYMGIYERGVETQDPYDAPDY